MTKWLYSTEMFARPSKQLPGRWRLFEYYLEAGEHLVNLKENHLKQAGYYWNINFKDYGKLSQQVNLPIQFLSDFSVCSWQTSRNFLSMIRLEATGIKDEFQFAISKGDLKLLKKDNEGKIIFFGFFKKLEEST